MFGDVAKLFDRNFAVGYVLPVALWAAASYDLSRQEPSVQAFFEPLTELSFAGFTVVGLGILAMSILLQVLNFPMIQVLEGINPLNPAQTVGNPKRQRDVFQEMKDRIKRQTVLFQEAYDKPEQQAELGEQLSNDMRRFVARFPDTKSRVMPTAFGNAVRAFEVYPSVMYEVEAVTMWDRLLGVIPKEYLEHVSNAKAQVDFAVNTTFLALLAAIEACAVVLLTRNPQILWQPLAYLLVAFWAYRSLPRVAIAWGDTIRAAFDLYLPALGKQMGLDMSGPQEQQRKMWLTLSQAVTFREPGYLPKPLASQSRTPQPDMTPAAPAFSAKKVKPRGLSSNRPLGEVAASEARGRDPRVNLGDDGAEGDDPSPT